MLWQSILLMFGLKYRSEPERVKTYVILDIHSCAMRTESESDDQHKTIREPFSTPNCTFFRTIFMGFGFDLASGYKFNSKSP